MSRLPVVNSDNNVWGSILNDYLLVSHNDDGTLRSDALPDATTTTKGSIQLAGDLSGTASSPTVVGLSSKANDNAVVHLSNTETITGDKNFTGGLTINGTNVVVTTDSRLTDSRTPTGTASGDLSGTYPSPVVSKIGGISVSGTPSSGQVITASSSSAATWSTPSNGLNVAVQSSAPVSPTTGELWVDTSSTLTAATGPAAWTTPTAWSSSTTYTAGPPASAVYRNGSSYVALTTNINIDPATDGGANWQIIAQVGANGGSIPLDASLTLPSISVNPPSATGKSSDSAHTHSATTYGPKDYGYLGWSVDLTSCTTTTALSAGVGYSSVIRVPTSSTLSNVILYITNTPSTLANSYVAVYYGGASFNSTLLGQSSDQSSTWTASGRYVVNIGTNLAYTGSFITVVFWVGSASTMASFARASNLTGLLNGGLSPARFGTIGSSLTTTPPSTGFTVGQSASTIGAYFVGIS